MNRQIDDIERLRNEVTDRESELQKNTEVKKKVSATTLHRSHNFSRIRRGTNANLERRFKRIEENNKKTDKEIKIITNEHEETKSRILRNKDAIRKL